MSEHLTRGHHAAILWNICSRHKASCTRDDMKKPQATSDHKKSATFRTTTFLLELPLVVNQGQAKRLRAHLEAARQFYNAILSLGQQRLRRMRADPAWQEARTFPRTHKAQRAAAFSS